ncbi:EF-hand domain-containing protein [Moorena sp. SIO3H5]|uniref:EF-hand domain-containing protein n=1 Tax=Moorena sp. SIO3H5 TaxID=2607834 RepID=UPI0013B86B36|nr:EF-hand domain-containing protein [Moorena sp. SIO3H5]NEO71742.1 EF-hand domain-containing protein [Moorena sp. SIO3H5]
MLSPFIQRKIALAFYKYDQSKNGVLEKEDLQIIGKKIAEYLGFKQGDYNYHKILDTYTKAWDNYLASADQDGDGKVSLVEFLEARANMDATQVEKNQEFNKLMFDCLDLDGNGTISLKEYEAYLKALGETNQESIKRGFESLDINQDGLISRDEYAKLRSDYGTSEDPEDPSKWFYGTF